MHICHPALCLLFALAVLATHGSSQTLVIKNVTLIDGTGSAAQPAMTVVVAGERILEVGPAKKVRVRNDAVVVDGTGKFLIPGLWDMHVHGTADEHASWTHLLFVANGVVGVRDMFGPHDANAWRASQAGNQDPSPTIYLGSPVFDGPNPTWPHSVVVANEAEGRAAVDQQQQRGADFIKVYDKLDRDVYFAIVDEANKRGIPFEGHVPDSITADEASDAGQRSIEHLTRVALACSKDRAATDAEMKRQEALFRAPDATMAQRMESGMRMQELMRLVVDTYDDATAQALFARFVKNHTWQCPTLTLHLAQTGAKPPADDPRWKYLSKPVRTEWDAGYYYMRFPPPARDAMIQLLGVEYAEDLKIVSAMYRAGVPILAGTDDLNPYCFPGFSLHDELALLVEAGLSPMAALQSATRNAAQFMGQFDRRGTIEAGKIADLDLLDKDPLADIHNTRTIHAAVLKGRLFQRAELDAMLERAQMLAAREPESKAGQ